MIKPLKIFITYSHKNTRAKNELITRLARLKSEGIIDIWHDNEILPGDVWRDTIFTNLVDSDLLLYLVSAHSLASKNCNEELAAALNAKIRVIPIILENCDWLNYQLSDFQALPDKGLPITKWDDQSEGWQNVVNGIRKAVNKLQSLVDSLSETSEKELRTELVCQFGNALMMFGQIDLAIETYSKAIELNNDDAAIYNNRGGAYANKGEINKAVKDFNKAITLKPTLADPYYNRGNTHEIKGEIDCAIEDYTKAIILKPEFSEAYTNRGNAYNTKGEIDCAIKDYTKAITLKPTLAESYAGRGNAYYKKGETDCAIEDCTKAIRLDPKFDIAYANRGNVYLSNYEVDLAIADLNKAIKLNPDYAEAYAIRGNAHLNSEDNIDLAIADFTAAIRLNSNLVGVYYNRGLSWLHLKEWEKAKSDFLDAKNMGLDIINTFHCINGGVVEFEQEIGFQLPEDITILLTQQ